MGIHQQYCARRVAHLGKLVLGLRIGFSTHQHGNKGKIKDFEFPSPFFHASVFKKGIPNSPNEKPTSYNRFSTSLAQIIFNRGYKTQKVLNAINDSFNKNKTTPANRELRASKDATDVLPFALKPVFQFISGTEPTAIPYWAGVSTQSTISLIKPSPGTWRQCVMVDPTGKLKPGSKVKMSCNGKNRQLYPADGHACNR
jgi:hypothetical protein